MGRREAAEQRARDRAARFRELDAQLREVFETRELPRKPKLELPADGTLPAPVQDLLDDGQVVRARNLLANLAGLEADDATARIAAARRRA